DLIRGLRANKKDEKRYIQLAIAECRREAKSQDVDVKAGAILKLTYLAMFGQDMAWASFATVEVMASPKFVNKRIGYMAAAQGFRQDTDVLMLSTNQMKKDLASSNASDGSIALSALADIATPDLARDLSHDVIGMLGHSKASVRKKAVLVMYKIFLQYPEALRSSYPKLRERLEDTDQSVVSATINVITELSRRNPKNYLTLAPILFELLTTSTNNWMLIKIIKLFATLTPLEPRLTKKLITPLTDLIQSTPAMSLLYECINTVISGDILKAPNSDGLARLCNAKLSDFFEQGDQNLKYVAIIALTKLSETHPELVSSHQAEILACVDDADLSIRLRALELVCLMPTKKSLPDVVKRLVLQLLPNGLNLPDQHRRGLVLRLIKMCRMDNYKHIDNFDWYIAVLVDLVKISKVDVGEELRQEILNVCVRVRNVREFAVPTLARLLHSRDILEHADDPSRNAAALQTAAWAVGEYSSHLEDPRQTLNNMLAAPLGKLASPILCAYLQAIPKLFTRWASEMEENSAGARSELTLQIEKLQRTIAKFATFSDIEVQQRALELVQIFEVAAQVVAEADADADNLPFFSEILPNLYLSGGDLNPIAPSAQAAIAVPIELDLDS
ncbi:Clathrin/coatomer adaptor, adaptin-like protein, partial [Protomyces lactucae-debilis]